MTIKDLEERTGLSRANIRFYEKEGLLSPLRRENGYREYTEEDVQTLLRVKLFRGLRLPLDEIRAAKEETKSMEAVMGTHLHRLQKEKSDIERAEQVCRRIQDSKTKFKEIDAQEYLDKLKNDALFLQSEKQAQRDTSSAVPIRRFIARLFDMELYNCIWLIIFLLITREYPLWLSFDAQGWTKIALTAFGSWFDVFAWACPLLGLLTMILLEPLWIRLFRATPGKFIMGLRFSDPMPLRAGLRRTWRVIEYGFGFFIPIYIWYRWWKSYWNISYGEGVKWDDEGSIVESKPSSEWFLAIKLIGGCIVLAAGIWLSLMVGYLSPNQGPLTISEFEENCCFYNEYYFADGKPWFLNMREGNDPYPYPLEYETEDGIIKAIHMDCEGTEFWIDYDPDNTYVRPIDQNVIAMILLVMERDYMQADVPYSHYQDLMIMIEEKENFSYEENGIRLEYQYGPTKGSSLYLQVME